MIETDIERLIRVLKQQAELFLLDAKEFYPFGTYINMQDEIVPVGAYPGGNHPLSSDVIDLLERSFKESIRLRECKIGAIALDILIRKNGEAEDGIEIRFFEGDKDVYNQYFKYVINNSDVEFYAFGPD